MNVEAAAKEIWNEDSSKIATDPLRMFLYLLSIPYGKIIALRNFLFDKGCLKQRKLSCPVVSVGNLAIGGTGKTPTVVFIARLLQKRGYRPAVLSRGYGGSAKSSVNVVSDGNRLLAKWHESGDEPFMIARALPGIPVLTGPERFLTGRAAMERFGVDIVVLDDAFQHRSIYRDINIVLIDAARPFGNGFLLPRGPLREFPDSLDRADIILRTGHDEDDRPLQKQPSVPIFRATHQVLGLVSGKTEQIQPATVLKKQAVFAFGGIGRPEAFRQSLTSLGAEVVAFRPFPDHYRYRECDIEALRRLASDCGAAWIITTEKDGVRLADFPSFLAGVFLLRIGMNISPGGPFEELIFSRLAY